MQGEAADFWKPLFYAPNTVLPYCGVCGRPHPLNQHHCPPKSAGHIVDQYGRKVGPKTFTLCGIGNNLRDADGNLLCHGLWHANFLHLQWFPKDPESIEFGETWSYGMGRLKYLVTTEPVDHCEALDMPGWKLYGKQLTDVNYLLREYV